MSKRKYSVEHVYSRLFTLPSFRMVVFLAILSSVLLSIPYCLLLRINLKLALLLSLSFILMSFLSSLMSNLLSKRDPQMKILDLRRILALVFFSNLLSLILLIITVSLHYITPLLDMEEVIIFSLLTPLSMRLVVFYGLSQLNLSTVFLSSFFHPLFLILPFIFLGFLTVSGLLKFVFLTLIFFLLFLFFLKRIRTKLGKTDTIKLFKGFAANWILGSSNILESELKKIAETVDLPITIIQALDESNRVKGSVIISPIHPGPFRNIGSSNISYELIDSLSSYTNSPVVLLHGATTHEYDLVSQDDVDKVKKAIKKSIQMGKIIKNCSRPSNVISDNCSVTSIKLEDLIISLVSQTNGESEDISFEIEKELNEQYKGGERIIIVDLHNSFSEKGTPVYPGEKRAYMIIKAILDSIKVLDKEVYPVSAGFSHKSLQECTIDTIKRELGPGGISCLSLEIGGEILIILSFDSNNMVRELSTFLAKRIREVLSGKYNRVYTAIATTDTHYLVATFKETGYYPLGSVTKHEIIANIAEDLVKESIRNMSRVRFRLISIIVRDLNILGSKYHVLKSVIGDSYARLKRFITIDVPIILLLVIVSLLLI